MQVRDSTLKVVFRQKRALPGERFEAAQVSHLLLSDAHATMPSVVSAML